MGHPFGASPLPGEMLACPRCGSRGFVVGRCVVCGHLEGEPPERPEPEGVDPVGPEREFCCRYCTAVFPSARACAEHQAARHLGVGLQLVSDLDP